MPLETYQEVRQNQLQGKTILGPGGLREGMNGASSKWDGLQDK
jgi:hypothetical protein